MTGASAGRSLAVRSGKRAGPACPAADPGLHSDVLMLSSSCLKDRTSPSCQSTYLPAVVKIAEPEASQVPRWHFLSTKDKNYLKSNLDTCSYRLAQELNRAHNSQTTNLPAVQLITAPRSYDSETPRPQSHAMARTRIRGLAPSPRLSCFPTLRHVRLLPSFPPASFPFMAQSLFLSTPRAPTPPACPTRQL